MRKVVLEQPHVVRIAQAAPAAADGAGTLVRLRTAGICGSDVSAYRGTSPMVRYPRVLGHEMLVDVLECRDRPHLEGRRAVLDPIFPCGSCTACRAGRPNCCVDLQVMGIHIDGGLQERWSIDPAHLHAVPDSMPDDVAVLTEPLTIAYHAVRRSGIEAGRTGVVFGAGTIGLLIARLLVRARGCRALVVDIDADRLAIARSLGAQTLQGDEAALTGLVAEATEGAMADVVFEASGSAVAARATTALAAHAGRIVLVGWSARPVEMDTVALIRKEIDLLGSRNSVNAFPAALRLLADGVIDPATLITHCFALEDTGKALETLDLNSGGVLKVLIGSDSSPCLGRYPAAGNPKGGSG